MLPCSLWAKNVFLVFRSLHVPLDTQFWTRGFPLVMRSRKADLPLATRARKRELCLYRYVSRMTRTENFISQFFFVFFFWKPLFSTFHVTLFIVSRKWFFRFFEVCTYPSIHNSGLEASPLVMRSRKEDLPLAIRAWKRELCLYRYVSRMTRTENFLSQNFL